MRDVIQQYQAELVTVGPVHIGSGKELSKKEYVKLQNNRIGVMDIEKFYLYLKKKRLTESFEEFMMFDFRGDLNTWLLKNNIRNQELTPFLKYTMDNGDMSLEKRARMQIMACVKDPYGNPYVPGSSIKGMLRTVLLSHELIQDKERAALIKEDLNKSIFSRDTGRVNRNEFLSKETKVIEQNIFNKLDRPQTKPEDAVNDILSGLVISDSEPLDIKDVILSQKVDMTPDGARNNLPLLRECIRPGCHIRFTITVDTSICSYTLDDIKAAVKSFMTCHYNYFQKGFPDIKIPSVNQVYLGGGCGFVSKTIIYPLYRRKDETLKDGIAVTQKIFEKTGVPNQHGHNKDRDYNASPHMFKETKYEGKYLPMGLCSFRFI